MAQWNPWHGCVKFSEGCRHCYVYREDARYERDPSVARLTKAFRLPLQKTRDGRYRLPSGETAYTCFTSDFFLDQADAWRLEAWRMIAARPDVPFYIITKRIRRFRESLPEDWGAGYENVTISVTCENQRAADDRLPVLASLPIRHKRITVEPMLEAVHIAPYLTPEIEGVAVGGESGPDARPMRYEWVLALRAECVAAGVPFHFHQTGALLIKDGRAYRIDRRFQHTQAAKAGIDTR